MDFRQGVPSKGWLLALAWAVVGAMPAGAQDDPNLRIGPTPSSPQLAPMQAEEKSQGAFGGTDAQVFIVTASEFKGRLQSSTAPLANSSAHGYYYSPGSVTPARYYAPVHLPAGAAVDGITCYVVDSSANDAHFELQSYYHDLGTNSPGGSSRRRLVVIRHGLCATLVRSQPPHPISTTATAATSTTCPRTSPSTCPCANAGSPGGGSMSPAPTSCDLRRRADRLHLLPRDRGPRRGRDHVGLPRRQFLPGPDPDARRARGVPGPRPRAALAELRS